MTIDEREKRCNNQETMTKNKNKIDFVGADIRVRPNKPGECERFTSCGKHSVLLLKRRHGNRVISRGIYRELKFD
jgi:hypothetical protein